MEAKLVRALQQLLLILYGGVGNMETFWTRPTQPLRKVFAAFCLLEGCAPEAMVFHYDGQILDAKDTRRVSTLV